MKIQSPWMGRIKGSAGNMTGCKVYDKNVMRAKAFEVSNPNTLAQQTERNFFAEVSACVSGVSEAELRSLFGVKPKTMSRRNALTKQVSEAYTIEGNKKVLDFSKLGAIGNGEKVYTPIVQFEDCYTSDTTPITKEMFGFPNAQTINLIFVIFDTDNNKIIIYKAGENELIDQNMNNLVDFDSIANNGYCYATCTTKNENILDRDFGSFIIKTRAEKK